MSNNVNPVLLLLRKDHHWDEKDLASELGITVDEYRDIELGKVGIDMDTAQKLSELYRMPMEYFLSNDTRSFHYNQGERSHSNSGYIQTYNDYSELLKQLFEKLKEEEAEIKSLKIENDSLKAELENIKGKRG